MRFYLSTDETIDAGDNLVGTHTIFNLAIGNGSAQSFPYTLDPALPIGVYHFGGIIDLQNQITEADENNNVLVVANTVEIYVPPPPAPDLTVTALSFDQSSLPELSSFTISHTVKNVGDLEAGTHHVDFYLSLDNTVTAADDIFIGSGLMTPQLAADAELQASTQVDLPAAAVQGLYYLGAIVSVDGGPIDTNEANNVMVTTLTMDVTP